MSAYDTTSLLAQARRLAFAPTNSAAGSADSDLISDMDFEMRSVLTPKLRSINEEYFVTHSDTTISSGVSSYAIPTRAVAGSLRDVQLVRTDNSLQYLPRLEISELPMIMGINPTQAGTPLGWYPEGNNLIMFPSPGVGIGSLRQYYEQRPGDLVALSAAGLISQINTGTGVVTCNIPGTFTTSQSYDFVKGTPHFDTWATNKTATAVGGATITFATTDLPSNLAVGDYVCLAGQSPVPQIPYELHPLLLQSLIIQILGSTGQRGKLQDAERKYGAMATQAWDSLLPRIKGKTRTAINRVW